MAQYTSDLEEGTNVRSREPLELPSPPSRQDHPTPELDRRSISAGENVEAIDVANGPEGIVVTADMFVLGRLTAIESILN